MTAQAWDLDEPEQHHLDTDQDDDIDERDYAEPPVVEHWSPDYDGTGARR